MLHLYLIVAISLHLLWLISNTTKRPTTSEFFQLFRTSAKFFQSAFLVILYQAFSDAPHSACLAVASRIAFRLTIRTAQSSHFAKLMSIRNSLPFPLTYGKHILLVMVSTLISAPAFPKMGASWWRFPAA